MLTPVPLHLFPVHGPADGVRGNRDAGTPLARGPLLREPEVVVCHAPNRSPAAPHPRRCFRRRPPSGNDTLVLDLRPVRAPMKPRVPLRPKLAPKRNGPIQNAWVTLVLRPFLMS